MKIIEKISSDLKLDINYISRVANRSGFYYKDYTIPKRNGGVRHVSQPSAELKTLQYWLVKNIFVSLPVSKNASAYKKGDSIRKHAQQHCKSKFILHTDICSFFNSIHLSHLAPILNLNNEIFEKINVDIGDAIDSIGKICFRNDRLCIGAVSSPIISNIIMFEFDSKLSEYCKSKGYIYSRYADDIYISSDRYIDKDIIEYISAELSNYNFKINIGKTKFYSSKYRRKVTGLIITNDKNVSVGTERRNAIKKLIYNKLVNGEGDSDQILGYLSFLKDVEPNTYNNIIIKYSKYCNEDIIQALSK